MSIVGLGAVARGAGAEDDERERKLVRDLIFDNLGVRGSDGSDGVGGIGKGSRVVDSARARVRIGDGGAKGDEGERWWRRFGEPVDCPRFGELGAERGDKRLGETGARRAW